MTVGTGIRQLRQTRGMSLEDLSCATDGFVSEQALAEFKDDRAVPMPTALVALARALQVKAMSLAIGEPVDARVPSSHGPRFPDDIDRRELTKLTVEERRPILRSHAEAIAEEYNREIDWEWLEADLER